MKNLLCFLFYFAACIQLYAQGTSNITIDASANGKSLSVVLTELEAKHGVDFIYEEDKINALVVTGVTKPTYISSYLELLLRQASLKLVKVRNNVFMIVSETVWREFGKKKSNYIVLKGNASAAQLVLGSLKDQDTGEPIIGAQIVFPETGAGVLSDANGDFQLQVPAVLQQFEVRYMGYETASYIIGFSPYGDTGLLKISLIPAITQLEAVTITAERSDHNVKV